MNQRRMLKKEIAKQKAFLKDLPRLIECSVVYGDYYYTDLDILRTERRIKYLEEQLAKLPKETPQP